MLRLDHQIAEPWPRGEHDLRRLRRLLSALRDQILIGRQPGLALGLARPRALAHPFELAFEGAAARRLLPAFLLETLLLLVEPARVIALVGDTAAAVELEDPPGHLVEEIAVVGHGHDGPGVVFQETLQPGDQFGVEMVGRLVEQQQIGPLQEKPAQCHPAPLAARQIGDLGVARRAAQRVHRDLDGAVEVPSSRLLDLFLQLALFGDQRIHLGFREVLGKACADRLETVDQRLGLSQPLDDVAEDVLCLIERRLLRQIANSRPLRRPGLASKFPLVARHDAQQGRFPGAVRP